VRVGSIDELADAYVDEWAARDPIGATMVGVGGHDGELTDLSEEGFEAGAELDRRTLARLAALHPADERERVARDAMQERLSLALERHDAGETASELSVIASALHDVRGVFDLMPLAGEEAVANIAARLAAVPRALRQFRQTLLAEAGRGHVAARRQMTEVAAQCDAWLDPDGDDFFADLCRRAVLAGPVGDALRSDLDRGASDAAAATAEFASFLRTDLAPLGRAEDAVGRTRYALASRYFLGAAIDLDETYGWGFAELARLESEMRRVAELIAPGGSVDEAVRVLDADPSRTIGGREEFRDWMQALADKAIADLHGTHFDIPEQVRRIECRIAPTSDGGIYYTGPSEDFSRPGRMWWAVPQAMESFSTWREVTTVYHEGVPGHHLQVAQTAARPELLNRWQRLLSSCSGHGEGWALYAENLMDELGYLEDPGDRLGMLDGQALRAARVVVDIGMHLQLPIPRDNPFGFHPGGTWTPRLVWEFMRAHCRVADELLRFEVNRYLGWPGQAAAYKVGERIWMRARADARARAGATFDLKEFHRAALNLGPLGLDPLKAALDRL
jgi:uncharacterized protein (DUF885 family)